MTSASSALPIASEQHADRAAVALLDRGAWTDAAIAWTAQRAVFLLLTIAGQLVIFGAITSPASLYRPWVSWDALWYAQIARTGYTQPLQAAFYPLYPLVERTVAVFTGGHYLLAGLLVSNAACLAAFALLRVLVEREFDRTLARRVLLYLACFPYAFFLAAAYTESLFLLLSVAAFLALRRRHWLVAGALAALVTLTRPVGIVLLVPLAFEGYQAYLRSDRPTRVPRRDLLRLAGGLAAPLLALASFWLYLASRFGTPFASANAQQSALWQRRLSWPWDGLFSVAAALLHGRGFPVANVVLDLLFTVAFIVLAALASRRVPWPHTIYSWASLLLVLVTPIHTVGWAALSSNPRFMLVVFPLFIVLARFERRWAQRLIVALSLVLVCVLGIAFAAGAFLA